MKAEELTKDQYLSKFDKCMAALNERFEENTYDYAEKRHPSLWAKMLEMEDGLNQTWGKDFKAFEKHLIAFYKLNLRMINLCKGNC